MRNIDAIREFVERFPTGICDDCISQGTRVAPRQQVNQLCRKLEQRDTIMRKKDRCALCGRTKTANVFSSGTGGRLVAAPPKAAYAQGEASMLGREVGISLDNVSGFSTSSAIVARLHVIETQLAQLLSSPAIRFDEHCRGALPETHGIYRIFDPTKPDETVRAGRTKTAVGGLRQRVYQNHLMGNQAGNLRAQLVADGTCANLEMAKRLIRESFVVQILAVQNEAERTWLEHFMLGVLRPRYSD